MRYGVYLPNQGDFADVGVLVELARSAEAAGWDGFFLWDELLPLHPHSDTVRAALGESDDVADPLVALTAVATATERIRFGSLVAAAPRLRPEAFARQLVTLDRLSGGRVVAGVGLGDPADQFTAFGLEPDLRIRAAMVDEFLDLVNRLWTGDRVGFDGAHYTCHGVTLRPTPLQRPRIPIWIGAGGSHRAPRRRAARWDGFAPASEQWPDVVISPETYAEIATDIRTSRTTDTPYDVVLIGNAAATEPTPATISQYEQAGVTWLLTQALTVADARERIRLGPPDPGGRYE
ncbi:putative F420-dependent oxidoreductase [Kribbella sp. VKM Ac-2527]|uniref:Putative F420-dependent oxidoreductase n=1 Tax=Kribbella caucasensis TaxID=2512215 RepID=A0A4R6KI20_9ACTN|nr:TIGR03619 family F420-dependent LLM class oxidoreductase [Kribbella sp. VKM Ac-2527]TDO50664.1 putative F420-dependent oxidoreductase [Kribbella sp. VKM Ac-2527]